MKTLLASLALAAILSIPSALAADPKTPEPAHKSATTKSGKPRALPFHGNIGSIDLTGNTIKVGKRMFHVVAETKLTKGGQAATLKDAAPGDEVGGSYRDVGGMLTLISLRLGPKS